MAVPGIKVYFKGNDMFVRALGLNVKDVLLTNSATVTARIQRAGVDVVGETWPLAMSWLQDGDFEGVLNDILTVVVDEENMTCLVVADDGPNRHAEWTLDLEIQTRKV